ncbi:MAG: replicative DNA helicase, partial [Chitinophagaceae bacterium]|nr:replicative DNA helicase [Chitinophagaceae bacterium]
LLHIQKFVEDDGDAYTGIGLPGGSWKPVSDADNGARVFIQTGSKMNEGSFPDEDETPF